MKKKLLCINNGFPTPQNPQFTTYIQTIVNCLEKSGFSVDVFVINYNKRITLFYKLIKYIDFWIKAIFINLKKYDIIYINHLPFVWPILFNRSLGKKKVYVHWHGNDLVSNTYFIRYILKLIKRRSTGFLHITPSVYFKNKLVEIMDYDIDDIFVSPSGGVNTEIFKPKYNSFHSKVIIGYSAALMKAKGADVFLELIKQKEIIERYCNNQIAFKLINYGPEAEYYINQINNIVTDVEIIEQLPKNKMPEFYQSIHILIMPSMGESLGLVVLEAMSCGIPVVTYNLCAFPEFVISGESGELVELYDDFNMRIDGFIKAVEKIVKKYQSYHPTNIVNSNYSELRVVDLYKELLR